MGCNEQNEKCPFSYDFPFFAIILPNILFFKKICESLDEKYNYFIGFPKWGVEKTLDFCVCTFFDKRTIYLKFYKKYNLIDKNCIVVF